MRKRKDYQAPPSGWGAYKGQWVYLYPAETTNYYYNSQINYNYTDGNTYIRIVGYSDFPVDTEKCRKEFSRQLKPMLDFNKHIAVMDCQKCKGKNNFKSIFQLHTLLKEAPDNLKIMKIQDICKSYSPIEV